MDELLLYDTLLDEARQPQQFGEMPNAELVLTGTNASCGDRVTIFLTFEAGPDSPITAIKWIGEGCVISQAAMSLLAGHILENHLTLAQVKALQPEQMEKLIQVPNISTGRIKCMMLGVKTLGTKGR